MYFWWRRHNRPDSLMTGTKLSLEGHLKIDHCDPSFI
jgi:hypothetical protein